MIHPPVIVKSKNPCNNTMFSLALISFSCMQGTRPGPPLIGCPQMQFERVITNENSQRKVKLRLKNYKVKI